jgi:hypothetical protein
MEPKATSDDYPKTGHQSTFKFKTAKKCTHHPHKKVKACLKTSFMLLILYMAAFYKNANKASQQKSLKSNLLQ